MKNLYMTGIFCALSAAILWGTAGTAQSFAHATTSPYWIGAFRVVFACVFFYLLFCFNRRNSGENSSNLNVLKSADYCKGILVAGICMGVYNLAFFAGVKATGIAVGSATTIGSAPIWAGMMQAIIMRKSPSLLWWAGTLCAILGGAIMVLSQGGALHINQNGLLLCLGAGFCYALYTLSSKKLVQLAPALIVTSHTFTVAMIIAAPAAFIIAGEPVIIGTDWLVILYLSFFTTGAAYLLYTRALKHISAPTGVALTLFEPITAFVLAVTIAHEKAALIAVGGLCLILSGLLLVLRAEFGKKYRPLSANKP